MSLQIIYNGERASIEGDTIDITELLDILTGRVKIDTPGIGTVEQYDKVRGLYKSYDNLVFDLRRRLTSTTQ